MANDFRLQVKIEGAGVVTFDKKKLRAAMREAGAEVAAEARKLIRSGSPGGRLYDARVNGGLELHQASAPGQPPASLSGALAKSIQVRPFRSGEGVTIRDARFYALFLEAGARGGGPGHRNTVTKAGGVRTIFPSGQRVLQPRPFLSAALDSRRASIEGRLRAAILEGVGFKRE